MMIYIEQLLYIKCTVWRYLNQWEWIVIYDGGITAAGLVPLLGSNCCRSFFIFASYQFICEIVEINFLYWFIALHLSASSDSLSPGSLYSNDSDTQGDHAIVFTGVTYLGSATVNAPRSEVEINRNMKILNEQSQMAIPVVLSVPNHSEGTV